jgi:hypothetical protein
MERRLREEEGMTIEVLAEPARLARAIARWHRRCGALRSRALRATAAVGLALVPAACAAPARAENVDVEELGWFQATATGPVVGAWRLFLEVQPRIGTDPANDHTNLRALIARAAVGHPIGEAWSLWAGYAYQPSFNPSRDEHRAFQQLLHTRQLGPFKMVNRTRFEQRMIEDAGAPALRLRHQLWLAYPLPRWPEWSLVVADEPFVNLNTVSDGPVAGFDQNRLYLGVSRQLGPHLRVEVDYLNQFIEGHRGADDVVRNGGFLILAFGW